MNDNGSADNNHDIPEFILKDILAPGTTAKVSTLTELWSLARMAKDVKGDAVWDALQRFGCRPEPLADVGYVFTYDGLGGIYFPASDGGGTVRFALPKLLHVDTESREKLTELVNQANSIVPECKFAVIDDEVWLILERFLTGGEDLDSMTEHILENLKSGAELLKSEVLLK